MDEIEAYRVFDDRVGATRLAIASSLGVVIVSVSGAQIGRFRLFDREPATTVVNCGAGFVAGGADTVRLVAGESTEQIEVPGVTALGCADDTVLAGTETGQLARISGSEWTVIGTLDHSISALDGRLVGTDGGVYLRREDSIEYVGLDEVYDVVDGPVPIAATETGLYRLGNGWMDLLSGSVSAVAITPTDDTTDPVGRVHVAGPDGIRTRTESGWIQQPVRTDAPIVDVSVDPQEPHTLYAITDGGLLLVGTIDELSDDDLDGSATDELYWTSQHLGVSDATAIATHR